MTDSTNRAADTPEIEVIGGYDQDLGDHMVCRPIPEWDVAAVKGLMSREQVRRYLLSLPDDFLINTYRHIQYRLLEDGSVWDCVGFARVQRVAEGPERAEASRVTALPEVDPATAEAYASGWRPLPPPKVMDNPCPQCDGRGICPKCLGSGRA
jgi:hypothetical protein